ncbi:hypothetical protein SpCBS45565_g05167 [Spizellomyces sp. 'palustris']|nr:hypothetical protein SpCBS45565_g05167 [Spizellomyces sp. 'palustris']
MSIVLASLSAVAIAESVFFLFRFVERGRLSVSRKIFIISHCLSHILQRITMMFYFDATISRDCLALAIIGNVFGLVLFRFTLLALLGILCMTLMKYSLMSKVICGLSGVTFLGHIGVLLFNTLAAPILDAAVCIQGLHQPLIAACNILFLTSFLLVAVPIIFILQSHLRGDTAGMSKDILLVYRRQLLFMALFTAVSTGFVIAQFLVTEWSWLMFTFIMHDIVWNGGLVMWLMPHEEHNQTSSIGSSGQKGERLSSTRRSGKLTSVDFNSYA